MKKIYIAGPMSGYKDFNFPAFMAAAKLWRDRGWEVFNPAEKDLEQFRKEIFETETGDVSECEAKGFSLRHAMAWDCQKITESDAIYLLKGWEHSSGAMTEFMLAKCLRLEFYYE